MKMHYEVSFSTGISDIMEFDDYDEAVAYAMKLHADTKKQVDVIKISEDLITRIGA